MIERVFFAFHALVDAVDQHLNQVVLQTQPSVRAEHNEQQDRVVSVRTTTKSRSFKSVQPARRGSYGPQTQADLSFDAHFCLFWHIVDHVNDASFDQEHHVLNTTQIRYRKERNACKTSRQHKRSYGGGSHKHKLQHKS